MLGLLLRAALFPRLLLLLIAFLLVLLDPPEVELVDLQGFPLARIPLLAVVLGEGAQSKCLSAIPLLHCLLGVLVDCQLVVEAVHAELVLFSGGVRVGGGIGVGVWGASRGGEGGAVGGERGVTGVGEAGVAEVPVP
jgi:hypothetical protein